MKDAALVQLGSAAWQTPRNGDFADYVERLTGGQAHVTLDEPGRVWRWSERTSLARTASGVPVLADTDGEPQRADAPVVLSGDAAAARGAAARVIGKIRWGLMLLTLLQIGLLVVVGVGTIVGVGISALLWWVFGRAKGLVEGGSAIPAKQSEALAQARRELVARAAEKRRKKAASA